MAEFKFEFKIISPQLYEDDGRKLSRDTSRGSITVTADNSTDAKKIARNKIKQGNTYKTMFSNLPSQDSSFEKKPRIMLEDRKTFVERVTKKLKTAGKGGSGSQQYEGTKEILPKPSVVIDRLKKQSGGRVDKALSGRNRYI